MRHRYDTRGIVLSRTPFGEANALLTVITPGLGLVRARAQGVRQSGAKLAAALTTFTESSLIFVKGKEGWRIAGAVSEEPWLQRLPSPAARDTAARVAGLVVRLVPGDTHDVEVYSVVRSLFEALETFPPTRYEEIEILAALRILRALGLDAGEMPEALAGFSPEALSFAGGARADLIARINRGIAASGL